MSRSGSRRSAWSGCDRLVATSAPGALFGRHIPADAYRLCSAHIAKFSDQGALEFIDFLDDAPAGQVQICTHGAHGFTIRNPSGPWIHKSAPNIATVDTVGAGDMFKAALLDLTIENASVPYWGVSELAELAAAAETAGAQIEDAASRWPATAPHSTPTATRRGRQ